jgi:hypothetical protein
MTTGMGLPIKLSEIMGVIDTQPEESSAYVNKMTGQIVALTEEEFTAAENEEPLEEYPEWQQEGIKAARDILYHGEDYLMLPTRYDINEYRIMEEFCLSVDGRETSEDLYGAIKGSGAFRRFKDAIHRLNLSDEWCRYRDQAIRQIAIDWCELHKIKFINE